MISLDQYSEELVHRLSLQDPDVALDSKQYLRSLMKETDHIFYKWFSFLPEVDFEIARLYYFDELTQCQIAKLMNITQASVSSRLNRMKDRLDILIKMPSTDPIKVRNDFNIIFDNDLFEFAYFYYFEPNQSRVRLFIDTSLAGAGTKLKKILDHLEDLVKDEDTRNDDVKILAHIYFDFFKETKKRGYMLSHMSKRHTRNSGVW